MKLSWKLCFLGRCETELESPARRIGLRYGVGQCDSDLRPLILSAPLIDPIVHRLVPELRILWLQHPMSFVGEVQHLRWDLEPLQGREELKAF
jgi:hypothetical protein